MIIPKLSCLSMAFGLWLLLVALTQAQEHIDNSNAFNVQVNSKGASNLGDLSKQQLGSVAPIKAIIRAPFSAPNILVEMSQVIYKHDRDMFFSFVKYLNQNQKLFSETDRNAYNNAITWIKSQYQSNELGTNDQPVLSWLLSIINFELANHSEVPKIIAQYRYYSEVLLSDQQQNPRNDEIPSSKDSNYGWVSWNGKKANSFEELETLIGTDTFYGSTYKDENPNKQPELSFDHVYPSSAKASSKAPENTAIFYTTLKETEFLKTHNYLTHFSDLGNTKYILRFVPDKLDIIHQQVSKSSMGLTGYSVELALKNTEYNVTNESDLFSTNEDEIEGSGLEWDFDAQSFDELKFKTPKPKGMQAADKDGIVIEKFSEDERDSLSLNAAQIILDSKSPIDMLNWIASDFPKYAKLVSNVPATKKLKSLATSRMASIEVPSNSISLNGLVLNKENLNPFTLINCLETERKTVHSLLNLGLTLEQATKFLSSERNVDKNIMQSSEQPMFDVRDSSEDKVVISWLNNLEKDNRYKSWSKDVNEVFTIQTTGAAPLIAKNILNVVVALDINTRFGLYVLFDTVFRSIKNDDPIRYGIVPISSVKSHVHTTKLKTCKLSSISQAQELVKSLESSESPDSTDSIIRVYYYVYHVFGIKKLNELFEEILKTAKSDSDIVVAAKKAYTKVIIKDKASAKSTRVSKLVSTFYPESSKTSIEDFASNYAEKPLDWNKISSCPLVSAIMCKHDNYASRLGLINYNIVAGEANNKNSNPKSDKTIQDADSLVKFFVSGYEVAYSKEINAMLMRFYQQTCILLLRKMFMGQNISSIKNFFTHFLKDGSPQRFRNDLLSSTCSLDSDASPNKKKTIQTQIGVIDLENSKSSGAEENLPVSQWISDISYFEQPLMANDKAKNAPTDIEADHPLTVWILADLESETGRKVVGDSIQVLVQTIKSSSSESFRIRLAAIHNLNSDKKQSLNQEESDDIGEENNDESDSDSGSDSAGGQDASKIASNEKQGQLVYLILKHLQENQEKMNSDTLILSLQYIVEFLRNLDTNKITGDVLINQSKHKIEPEIANKVVLQLNDILNKASNNDLLDMHKYYTKLYSMISGMVVKYGPKPESQYILKDQVSNGGSAIVINGRVFPPLKAESFYSPEIAAALFKGQWANRVKSSQKQFNLLSDHKHKLAKSRKNMDMFVICSAIIDKYQFGYVSDGLFYTRNALVREDIFKNVFKHLETSFDAGSTAHHFAHFKAVLDPLSEESQEWAPVLNTLSKMDGVRVTVALNPCISLPDLPLRKFKRYVISHKPVFSDSKAGSRVDLGAEFIDMPKDVLLTMGMSAPSSWLVTAVSSKHDLDNINLKSVKSEYGVAALFSLKYVLIEGHASEPNKKLPPSGLQVSLSKLPANITPNPENAGRKPNGNFDVYERGLANSPRDTLTGTIVMANLGYFQLKTQFGAYGFSVREGRSLSLFDLECIGTDSHSECQAISNPKKAQKLGNSSIKNYGIVTVDSFNGATIYPLFSKREGMEGEPILPKDLSESESPRSKLAKTGEKESTSMWGTIKNVGKKILGDKTNKESKNTDLVYDEEEAQLNIFVVASGHLYERLMSIMMVSVMKNTNSTVKFWIIENFMSPAFKAFMPVLAKEYNFKYEMITYKWPHWLNSEEEKQRTIWGYKILFLDVLFPLGLKRVIYVDADQIVRDDLQKLYDMDLEGAPYGYVPFCDDKKEIDGYRFWKVGYWKTHLQGKPYHISALYVVDLAQFRLLAAGDKLRFQYQSLSQDKNSLANLDQDLPNHLQHQVPIFSLPQDWLWCETWCSDDGLKRAKTIDLCNNPMTKEPKLKRAKRIIKEWSIYDNEIEVIKVKYSLPQELRASQEQDNQDENQAKVAAKEEL